MIKEERFFESSTYWENTIKAANIDLGPHDELVWKNFPPEKLSEYRTLFSNQVLGSHLVDAYLKEEQKEENGGKKLWITVYLHIKM